MLFTLVFFGRIVQYAYILGTGELMLGYVYLYHF